MTDTVREILHKQQRAGRFCFFSLPIYSRWKQGENLSFVQYSDEWDGAEQNSLTSCCKRSPEFSRMDELLFPLTDDVSWEFSPFFHSKLKINTAMNCISPLPVSLVSFCEESLRGPFVLLEIEGKEQHMRTCWHTFCRWLLQLVT